MTPEASRSARIAVALALVSGLFAIGVGVIKAARPLVGAVGLLAALAPLVPLVGFIVYVVRLVRSLDELERLIHLEALMLQFGATALSIMGYGMLARAGYVPNLTMVQAYPYLWISLFLYWALGLLLVRRRYR